MRKEGASDEKVHERARARHLANLFRVTLSPCFLAVFSFLLPVHGLSSLSFLSVPSG